MSKKPYKQANRVASVEIHDAEGIKTDDLLFNGMTGVDKLGQPFRYTVELLKNLEVKPIDISKLLGRKLTISLKPTSEKDGKARYFNGYIAEVRNGGLSAYGLECFYLLVVPGLWFLKKSSNCRIFKNKTVAQILSAVLKDDKIDKVVNCNAKDVKIATKLEHCVQYHETNFDFVHRLMEEYGVSYYFAHKNKEHEMILLTASGQRPQKVPESGFKEIEYIGSGNSYKPNTIRNWELRQQVTTDSFEQSDFNFASKKKFPEIICKDAKAEGDQGEFKPETFKRRAYGAVFDDGILDPHKLEKNKLENQENENKISAQAIADLRLGAYQAEKEIAYAESECRGLSVGYEFKLINHPAYKSKAEFYVTSVNHHIDVGGYGGRRIQSGKRYTCSITAIPKETKYYPLQITPKSRIYGPQTAIVVSEKATDDQLIYTDQHGRVKIRFYWDSLDDRGSTDKTVGSEAGKENVKTDTKNLSCWVRVAQGWAGNKWGSFFLPRVDQEVIVEFLDGDPDRPIITGSVYNGKNLPPYKLNDHDTISTIKSESVGTDGKKAKKITFNEIRFEDKEEKEQIFIHAGRSMDTRVLGDSREYVGCNMQLTIAGDKDNKEKTDDSEDEIGNRDVVLLKGNDQLTLSEGNLIQQIKKGSYLLDIASHGSINIGGALNIKVKGQIAIATDDAIHIKSGKSIVVEAKDAISFKAGKDITLDAKGAINLNSKDEVLCKGSSGIGLTGGKSTIDISSNVGIKGGSNVVIKGSKVDINGGPPKNPASPAAGESPKEPTIQSAKDLKIAEVNPAATEDAYIDGKDIKFGELK